MTTAETIITRAWALLRVDGSSTDVPGLQQDQMLLALDQADREWLRSFRRGGGEPPSTSRKEVGYTLIASTALAADITTSSPTVIVDDSSDAPSSGAFVIYDDGPDIGEF